MNAHFLIALEMLCHQKITRSRIPTARQANTMEAFWFAKYCRDALTLDK